MRTALDQAATPSQWCAAVLGLQAACRPRDPVTSTFAAEFIGIGGAPVLGRRLTQWLTAALSGNGLAPEALAHGLRACRYLLDAAEAGGPFRDLDAAAMATVALSVLTKAAGESKAVRDALLLPSVAALDVLSRCAKQLAAPEWVAAVTAAWAHLDADTAVAHKALLVLHRVVDVLRCAGVCYWFRDTPAVVAARALSTLRVAVSDVVLAAALQLLADTTRTPEGARVLIDASDQVVALLAGVTLGATLAIPLNGLIRAGAD